MTNKIRVLGPTYSGRATIYIRSAFLYTGWTKSNNKGSEWVSPTLDPPCALALYFTCALISSHPRDPNLSETRHAVIKASCLYRSNSSVVSSIIPLYFDTVSDSFLSSSPRHRPARPIHVSVECDTVRADVASNRDSFRRRSVIASQIRASLNTDAIASATLPGWPTSDGAGHTFACGEVLRVVQSNRARGHNLHVRPLQRRCITCHLPRSRAT